MQKGKPGMQRRISASPCVADMLNGRSRWQQHFCDLCSAHIPALVTTGQRECWTGTVRMRHTGASIQHLWGTQWDLRVRSSIQELHTETNKYVQTCPGGQVHPGVQGPGKHWVCGHRSSQVYGQAPEQSLNTWLLEHSVTPAQKKIKVNYITYLILFISVHRHMHFFLCLPYSLHCLATTCLIKQFRNYIAYVGLGLTYVNVLNLQLEMLCLCYQAGSCWCYRQCAVQVV